MRFLGPIKARGDVDFFSQEDNVLQVPIMFGLLMSWTTLSVLHHLLFGVARLQNVERYESVNTLILVSLFVRLYQQALLSERVVLHSVINLLAPPWTVGKYQMTC